MPTYEIDFNPGQDMLLRTGSRYLLMSPQQCIRSVLLSFCDSLYRQLEPDQRPLALGDMRLEDIEPSDTKITYDVTLDEFTIDALRTMHRPETGIPTAVRSTVIPFLNRLAMERPEVFLPNDPSR